MSQRKADTMIKRHVFKRFFVYNNDVSRVMTKNGKIVH